MKKRVLASALIVFGFAVIVAATAISAAPPPYVYEDQFGEGGLAEGKFVGLAGLQVMPWGDVYTVETSSRIQRFSAEGDFIGMIAEGGTGDGEISNTYDIAYGNGELYVADSDNSRVQVLGSGGTYRRQWALGNSPDGIALDRFGDVYVTIGSTVQKFDRFGTSITQWGSFGSGDGEFTNPFGIAVSLDDRVYVSDRADNRVQVFSLDGEYLSQWGSDGATVGKFDDAAGIGIDGAGDIYVADRKNDRVQKFDAGGNYLNTVGGPGDGDGQFAAPYWAEPNQWRQVYVSDPGHDLVQRFFSPVPSKMTEIAGSNRFTTAVAASKNAYPDGLRTDTEGYKTVIITTGRNWPDALGGAALAGVLDAPILLVEPDEVPAAVAGEIARLKADRAIILGSEGAVGAEVEKYFTDMPATFKKVTRIGGTNRYSTANLIAKEVVHLQGDDYDGIAFVATGLNFPDALAASPIASRMGEPIFLAREDGLDAGTQATMGSVGVSHAFILGGEAAVPAKAEEQAKTIAGSGYRFAGDTRYHTAVLLAEYGIDEGGLTMARTALATGLDFPDALAGGALQGRYQSVLLLTSGTKLEYVVKQELEDRKAGIYELKFLGGESAIASDVREMAEALLY